MSETTTTQAATPTQGETTQVNGTEFKGCTCGCGNPVAPKSQYRPGHDARHASAIGKRIAAENLNKADTAKALKALPTVHLKNKAEGIASNLKTKAAAKDEAAKARKAKQEQAAKDKTAKQEATAKTKAEAKAKREQAAKDKTAKTAADKAAKVEADAASKPTQNEDVEVVEVGTVKVGRWDYPVRMTGAGRAQRNTQRDGKGSWETVEATDDIVWQESTAS